MKIYDDEYSVIAWFAGIGFALFLLIALAVAGRHVNQETAIQEEWQRQAKMHSIPTEQREYYLMQDRRIEALERKVDSLLNSGNLH